MTRMLPTRALPTRVLPALLALALAVPGVARAASTEDLEETDELPVVQNRQFRTQHELSAGIGILPVDAFYKGMVLLGGYAWHINDLWAADGRFGWLRTFKTSLREDLEENFTIPSTRFAEIKWYAQAGTMFKPLYGKLSMFNSRLVYGELYLSLHGVIAQFDGGRADEDNPQGKGQRFGYGGAPGFGIRGYLNEYISMRFDFQTMILYSAGEMFYPISLSLTFAVTTRTDL